MVWLSLVREKAFDLDERLLACHLETCLVFDSAIWMAVMYLVTEMATCLDVWL